MIAHYKGFEIDVRREKSVIDNSMIYWGIFRKSDGMEMHSGCDYEEVFETKEGEPTTVRREITKWKCRVDRFLSLSKKEQEDLGEF